MGHDDQGARLMSVQGTVPGTSPAERTAWAVWSWIGRALTLAMAALAGAVALIYAVSVFVPPVARSTSNSVAVGVQLPEEVSLAALDQRSIVYAGDGSVLGVLHDDIDRQLVPLSQIPQHVRDAVITAEDRKFWEHEGDDVEGIGRALVANARAGVVTQGG
jgi:membrane peptidoglycan carboxypeptidase